MRGHRVRTIVSVVRSGEPLRFQIEIQTTGPTITGRWSLEGRSPRTFTGWTELFAALDAAVSGERGPDDVSRAA